MKVYRPGAGDKLHLDPECEDIKNGHRSALAQGYNVHQVTEEEFDPLGTYETNPLCVTCLKQGHTFTEETPLGGPYRALLDDVEISYSLLRAIKEEWRR